MNMIRKPPTLADSVRIIGDVVIEHRDGDEVLHVLGTRSAAEGVVGYYPAFDATPPRLVTRTVTERGVFRPENVSEHFDEENS